MSGFMKKSDGGEGQKEVLLADILDAYGESDYYPFHMPGHKRNPEFMNLPPTQKIDLTEIDGFDDLHHAVGILRDAQVRAARVRGAKRTWFLVNGSTVGILTAVSACVRPGGRILVARNCHKSVYHVIELRGLHPIYLSPKIDDRYGICDVIEVEDVARKLKEYPGIQAVLVTSPTFEGVLSDIPGIAEVAHSYGIPLIVDCAHGAHLGYAEGFAPSPVSQGADLVIESLHKTMPAMTQTALLHKCSDRVDDRLIQKYFSIYQTSSPSYVMMATMDQCMDLLETSAESLYAEYRRRLNLLRKRIADMEASKAGTKEPYVTLLNGSEFFRGPGGSYDDTKLILAVRNRRGAGKQLYDLFRDRYHLQMEMAGMDYVMALTSFCDTDEGFDRLYQAIMDMNTNTDENFWKGTPSDTGYARFPVCAEVPDMMSSEAVEYPLEYVKRKDAVGRISGAYLFVYPPGVPFCVPGERVTDTTMKWIESYEEAGLRVLGLFESDSIQEQRKAGVPSSEIADVPVIKV